MKSVFGVLALLAASACAGTVTVQAPSGTIVGENNGAVNVFRGIPYAEQPVGDLRWQPTVPVKRWSSPLMATQDAPGCPQDCELPPHTCPPTTSEACLFLNIFAPAGATKAPVLLFVHGGNFKQGYPGGLLYNGTSMAVNHGTIVVSIAYRLGALGFLNSGGGSIQGMYGIQDQQEAMRWVRKNIAAFGGDPTSLTLFGQSAGAMSLATHLVLPSSEDLFERAILESDPFTSPFRTASEYAKVGTAMGEKAGCSSTSGPALDTCLRGLSVADIITAQVEVEKDLAVDFPHVLEAFLPWTPYVDPAAGTNSSIVAITDQPRVLFARGQLQDKPFIVGTVENEALLFIYEAFGKPLSHLDYDAYLAVVFGIERALEVGAKYPLPSEYDDDARRWLAHIGTKALFQCSTRNATLGASATGQNVWLYHFDHVMSFSKAVWGPNFTICDDAVCHAEELPFVWHPDASRLNLAYTPDEEALSAAMESYWTSFARTGNPNAEGTQINWPPFTPAGQQSMLFQTPQNAILSHNQTTECDWWANTIGFDFE